MVDFLNQLRGILLGYKINVYLDHKNLVYTTTWSESQILMCWQLTIEYFGPKIHHIAGVDNIVADTLTRLPSTTVNRYETSTTRGLLVEKTIYL